MGSTHEVHSIITSVASPPISRDSLRLFFGLDKGAADAATPNDVVTTEWQKTEGPEPSRCETHIGCCIQSSAHQPRRRRAWRCGAGRRISHLRARPLAARPRSAPRSAAGRSPPPPLSRLPHRWPRCSRVARRRHLVALCAPLASVRVGGSNKHVSRTRPQKEVTCEVPTIARAEASRKVRHHRHEAHQAGWRHRIRRCIKFIPPRYPGYS